MANVFIPASIRDKATRDTLIAIVRELANAGSTTVNIQADDPGVDTPGVAGDVIYATGSDSIWVFTGTVWERGSSGAQGQFTLQIYIRDSDDPDQPTGGSYVYSTDTLTPPTDWANDIGDLSGDLQVWFSEFTYDPANDPDTITPTWSTPAQAGTTGPQGEQGDPGQDGNSAGSVSIFIRSGTIPVTPSDTTDYNTADGSFTAPTGWAKTVGGTTGNNTLYTSTGNFFGTGDVTIDWSAPIQLQGTDGMMGNVGNTGPRVTVGVGPVLPTLPIIPSVTSLGLER